MNPSVATAISPMLPHAAPRPAADRMGATVDARGTTFAVWAPNATRAAVRFYDAAGNLLAEDALEPRGEGVRGEFARWVPGVQAGVDYRFVLDDDDAVPDPASRCQPHGVHGPSRVVDPSAFAWTDHDWRGLDAMADYVIYELHVGTFTAEGTFDAAIAHLAELRALGITAIEIMPIAEFPGRRNWGYDGVHLYAPLGGYGGPEGLRRLVDAAHAHGIAVVLDVVYNHLGPEGNYLDRVGPYFTDRYQTPWGRAVNYDGPGADGVRRHVIDNACHWVEEYHVDALRLDAVHGIYDLGARHVLAELTDAVRARAESLGRRAHLIAESDLSDPRVVRPTAQHGLGFDAQWADDLHHAVHVALTGETSGYYEDFARYAEPDAPADAARAVLNATAALAAALRAPFVYDGRWSPHRARRFGASAAALPRERFVVCAQNHDQIGNRAAGDRLSTLVDFPAQRLAAAVTLLAGYVPMLFMGEEYGETRPFPYFVSHGDPELVRAVRDGRRREFAAFGWGDEVPDPQSPDTFASAVLDRAGRDTPRGAALLALHRDLLALRRAEPALRPGDADVDVSCDAAAGWVTLTLTPRSPDARTVCVAFDFATSRDGARDVPLPGGAARWTRLLTTEDARYGGPLGAQSASVFTE